MQKDGKLQAECERPPCDDESGSHAGESSPFLLQQRPATSRSLRINPETAVEVLLTNDAVTKIPITAFEPLWEGSHSAGGLLIGRSSSGIQGLIVILGLIDSDFTGNINIMAYTLQPPMMVPKGSRIAQIIPIENVFKELRPEVDVGVIRGKEGFGSTGGIACFTMGMGERPMQTVTLQHKGQKRSICTMLDTGADMTIIGTSSWPPEWQTCVPPGNIEGVGGSSTPRISLEPVQISMAEGQLACTWVYVMVLPGTIEALIGRDVLTQWGVTITTDQKHFR